MDKPGRFVQQGAVHDVLDVHDAVRIEHENQGGMKRDEQKHGQDPEPVQVVTALRNLIIHSFHLVP